MKVSIDYDELRDLRNELDDYRSVRDMLVSYFEHYELEHGNILTLTETWIKNLMIDVLDHDKE